MCSETSEYVSSFVSDIFVTVQPFESIAFFCPLPPQSRWMENRRPLSEGQEWWSEVAGNFNQRNQQARVVSCQISPHEWSDIHENSKGTILDRGSFAGRKHAGKPSRSWSINAVNARDSPKFRTACEFRPTICWPQGSLDAVMGCRGIHDASDFFASF